VLIFNSVEKRKEEKSMSEREKEIIKKLSNTLPQLSKDKQNYILGVAEGMAIARECESAKVKESEVK
jgi:hypothetical protein